MIETKFDENPSASFAKPPQIGERNEFVHERHQEFPKTVHESTSTW
jgi:hypothetical protein